jgi:hypothetical protein
MRVPASILLAVLALAGSTSAAAQDMSTTAAPRTAALSWVRLPGAEACPTTQAVAQAAETILGHAVFVSASSADLVIEGRVEPRAEGGFRATLAVDDAGGASLGERIVEAEGACGALLDPLSIVLAILVDPDATLAERAEEPDPDPEVVIETRVVTERVEVPVLVQAPRWRLDVDLGAVLSLGLTPFVAPGGHASFFLTPPGFVPFGVHGVIVPWSRAELGGAFIDHLAFWAGVAICPLAIREGRFRFAACGGVDVGGVFVVGQSAGTNAIERERFTVAADVSIRAGVHLVGPLVLVLSAALVVPFRTEGWRREPLTTYYVPEPVGLVVSLGPSLDFEL